MTMNPPLSLPSPALPVSLVQYSKDENRGQKNVSRFKRMADSTNQNFAAKLLLQMGRIAADELLSSKSSSSPPPPSVAAVHLISPMHRPKELKYLVPSLSCIPLPNSPPSPYTSRIESQLTRDDPAHIQEEGDAQRLRAVSIGGVHDLEVPTTTSEGHVSPFRLETAHEQVCVPPGPAKTKKKLVNHTTADSMIAKHPSEDRWNSSHCSNLVSAKSSFETSEDEMEETPKSCDECSVASKKTLKKYVGETLAPGVAMRDVLRKKFSWKSFPELESYLIAHRIPYLACSNAMNYTKAQKQYNNELTQGLLDLARAEGYVFEGFSFAMVRDRIRCFYKSFVQATKKKKRPSFSTNHIKRVRTESV